jgi:hypothetical protein
MTSIVLPRSAANDQGIFRAYILRQGQEANVALFARTASGEGTAGVGVWFDRQIAGSAFSRQSETELLGSGTASYTGQYGGYLVGESVSVVLAMAGDAAFTADFDAGVISGAISNRVGTGFGSFDFADLTLAETAIGSGAFTGDASGGQLLGSQFPASTTQGSYSGLFTGASGQEVVGGVAITHEDGVEVYKEYGAFVTQ